VNKRWALFGSRNRTKKFRKLGWTKPSAKEGQSSARDMDNKPVWIKLSPEPEGEEMM